MQIGNGNRAIVDSAVPDCGHITLGQGTADGWLAITGTVHVETGRVELRLTCPIFLRP